MPPRNSSQLFHSELYRSDFFNATATTPSPRAQPGSPELRHPIPLHGRQERPLPTLVSRADDRRKTGQVADRLVTPPRGRRAPDRGLRLLRVAATRPSSHVWAGWIVPDYSFPLDGISPLALTGVALMQATNTPSWLGLAGVIVGGLLMICSFEFVGAFEDAGWRVAAVLTPIAYV